MRFARIAGTGGYLPERIVTNADLEELVDTSDTWIIERTGIRSRRVAGEGQSTCDLAEQASLAALESAGISAADLDLILVATTTPDRLFPGTACLLQHRLGNKNSAAFDLQAVCTGFLYALSVADKFIQTRAAERILVVGAETFSRLIDWKDRSTCILFGDGAGAVVLEADAKPGIRSTHLHADGGKADQLTAPGYVAQGRLQGGSGYTAMRGNEVFKLAVTKMSSAVEEAMAANGLSGKDVDWLIPHQANIRIINAIAKKLKMPLEQVVVTVGEHGNTSAASVPLALDVAVRDGRIKRGDTLLLVAMGGGFTWGSALLTY
ncbi:MAG: ketoacyl-ACP synthase III [Gammaproteobacteria bacterium]|nr:ketoacyl-ACP synthase III [Gammaproteobacteria bacterium]